MKNFKKFLTLVLAVMMVVSSFAFSTSAATTKFEDIDAKNETLVKAVDLLNYMGIAKGKSETEFGADELVTREQFCLFMYRLMKGGKDAPANASNSTKFTDLQDSTYFYAISWAYAQGIVKGRTATTFGPKDPITLQEAYAMIVRALDWEKENDLVYPFGQIEVAEQDGVELDKDLPSDVSYTDYLTRGDMAILLYNAFFAETGIEEVTTKEKKIGNDDAATWVLYEYTTNPRLCEKAFDVVEVEYQAIATPHYTTSDVDATYNFGYDAIYFEMTDDDVNDDATDAPDYAYLSAEDLGLGEDLDEYFLGHFTMFVTVDDDEKIEKVLFADCNMTKKTVTDIKLGEVSTNKASSYFSESDGEAKLLSGKITADGEEIYAFNAPYSYASPSYDARDTYSKYYVRNAENIEALTKTKTKDGDDEYYTFDITDIVTEVEDDEIEEGLFETQATDLLLAFYNAYYNGLYEADIYDVDGDGIYDYIYYTPYSFFQVDSDEDEYFEDSDFDGSSNDNVPYIYTNEAKVTGEKFADEDYVIGYFDEDLEIVKVAAVIKPTVSSVKNFKKKDGTITLTNGDKVDAVSAWKLFGGNFDEDDIVWDLDAKKDEIVENSDLFDTAVLDDSDEYEFYIYNGMLLMDADVDTNVKFTENLIIPTDLEGTKAPRSSFDSVAGEDTWYVYAWVDGKVKYVPVETEDTLPGIIDNNGGLTDKYADKLCTYSVDADGIYTIKSLGYDVDDDTKAAKNIEKDDITVLDDDKDDDIQFYVDDDEGTITKNASRFTVGTFERSLVLKSYTTIVIRVYDEDEDEYTYEEYDASNFTKSLDEDVVLENMTYVVGNNPDSKTRENLVLLYAETDDLAFKGTKDKDGYRIISNYDIGEDDNGDWRVYYELYDPFTGAKVEDVPSVRAKSKASQLTGVLEEGTIVNLVDGMVQDDKAKYVIGEVDTDNLVWISEYDEADGFITVVPYNETFECKDCIDGWVEENDESDVNDIYGEEIGSNYIDIDKNTVVSVIKYSDIDSIWNWGTMSLSNASAIASAKNEVLCYNDKAEDRNGNYKTAYADYIKAYVSVDTDVDDDENPVAEFIIIVVNGDEAAALDNVCNNH